MRYYIIINGVNSLTIPGLAIRTLPPISKPAMRNLREEIDGRDGDITTELGYGAYDRILEIGLYGDYDIDRIISFFNTKGTIIFSDEPDKYYNFEIVDKIDYTKLVKFRTASINIHCQPFKYPTEEEPEVEEYEYVEETGENITLNNTAEAILNKIDLLGNTSQQTYTGRNLAYDITQYGKKAKFDIIAGKNYTFAGILEQQPTNTNPIYTSAIPNIDGSASFSRTYKSWASTTPVGTLLWYNVTALKTGTIEPEIFGQSGGAPHFTNIMIIEGTYTEQTLPTYEPYVGGIPAPNPDYPQDVHVVSGDNVVEIIGRNLCSLDHPGLITNTNGTTTASTYNSLIIDTRDLNYVYISGDFSLLESNVIRFGGYYQVPQVGINGDRRPNISANGAINVAAYDYILLNFTYANGWTQEKQDAAEASFMISKGQEAVPYETPRKQTYPINLGDLEMAAIPNTDYKDVFVKDEDTWYKREIIGKVDLSTLTWINGGQYSYTRQLQNIKYTSTNQEVGDGIAENYKLRQGSGMSGTQWYGYMAIDTSQITINPSNNTKAAAGDFYYVHTTAVDTEVNETLSEQLDAIKNAISYSGQTNVSQTNNDGPFILDISALKEGSDHLVINNSGNIYAKPTIDIEGTGVVDIYLNDVQILEADLSETNNIVIDTEAMEAYNPDTNALANRQVTGDYSKIKLEPGENDLRFSGDLSKATVTKYKRWL